MILKDLKTVETTWMQENLRTKDDLILLLKEKYDAYKVALALGLCLWRGEDQCKVCRGKLNVEERGNSCNVWWRCVDCRTYVSTMDGTLFQEMPKTSWKHIITVLWETSYDACTTSAHIARVWCLQSYIVIYILLIWYNVT